MGIRISSAVVFGVKFTAQETKAFEAFMKGKPQDWFLMRMVEQQLAFDWKYRDLSARSKKWQRIALQKEFISSDFIKRDKKKHLALHPYRPFWAGYSKKKLEDVGNNLIDATRGYCESIGCKDDAPDKRYFWWPHKNSECDPANMFGYVQDHRYAADVDYAFFDLLCPNYDGIANKIYTLKGKRPWECGTCRHGRDWMTFNGQNFLPRSLLPKNEAEEILKAACFQKGGAKTQFIATKKAIWDKYHGYRYPYKTYACDGWGGADFYFRPVDIMFKLISEHIPEVKYNVMRLEKYLCLYWS